MKLTTMILSAGNGSRMQSTLSKPLHLLGGVPMVEHLIIKAKKLQSTQTIAVIGTDTPDLENYLSDKVDKAYQQERLGSGHAVLCTKDTLKEQSGVLLILYADTPLVSCVALEKIIDIVKHGEASVVVLAFNKTQSNHYGKLVVDGNGHVLEIVEHADASEEQKQIKLCNSGLMAISLENAWEILGKIDNKNRKGEYYLTDSIRIANEMGLTCKYLEDSEENLRGANTKSELAELETIFQNQRRKFFLNAGVQMIDPSTTYFSLDTKIGNNVIIYPNVFMFKGVEITDNTIIYPFTTLEGTKIGENCNIGPFARLRAGTHLTGKNNIGNFVEIKKSTVGLGSKINHLSYIGDTTIGEKTNIGAGTITCNYDGVNKYGTKIGNNAFIGSNTALVAPVVVGDNATIGAGSTITKDIPNNTLAVNRSQQRNIEGWKKRIKT